MINIIGIIALAASLALTGCGSRKEMPLDGSQMQNEGLVQQSIQITIERSELVGSNLELISTEGGKYSCDIFLVKAVYLSNETLIKTDAVVTISKRSQNEPGTVSGIVIHAENQQVADYWTHVLKAQEEALAKPSKN